MEKKGTLLFSFLVFFSPLFRSGAGGEAFSQQASSLDAIYIADNYFNSIVKILLYDSLSEKKQPHSGYIGRGSGFVVSDDGIIFTNKHVIEYCTNGYVDYNSMDMMSGEIYRNISPYSDEIIRDRANVKINRIGHAAPIVQVFNGKGANDYALYYAKVIAYDAGSFDGAILKIISDLNGNPVTDKFHPVHIGNSDSTKQGEDLCIYGFPSQYDAGFELMLQDQSTLTFGKHSGFDYVFNKEYGYIKTDASINNGNSGGPVFNKENKVIGIATATGSKTNIGLIGGINAMFNIAEVQKDILKTLKVNGLKPPRKSPSSYTSVMAMKKELPRMSKIKYLQSGKTQERKFQNGALYIKPLYASSPADEFTLDTTGGLPVENPNTPFVLASAAGGGLETGFPFPIWRISTFAKLSLDYTFVGARVNTISWDKIKLNDSIADSTINYTKDMLMGNFYMKLGPSVSFLLFKQTIIEAHYQSSLTFFFFNHEALYYSTPSSSSRSLFLQNSVGLNHEVGGSMRFRFVSIGAQYVFSGRQKLDYQLMTSPGKTVLSYPLGKLKTKVFLLIIGFHFGGGD